MNLPRIILTIAILGVGLYGALWVVCAQEGRPIWTPPPILPTDETAPLIPPVKLEDKKAPIKAGQPKFNEKSKPDATLIIPAEVYEKPRPLEMPMEIVPVGGVTEPLIPPALAAPQKKDVEPPPLPALLPETKPVVVEPIPPLMPPPMSDPTKVLIGELPLPKAPLPQPEPKKDPEPKKPLISPPSVFIEPKQEPIIPPPTPFGGPQGVPPTGTQIIGETIDRVKSFRRINTAPVTPPILKHDVVPSPPIKDMVITPGPIVPPPSMGPGALMSLQAPSVTVEKRGAAKLRQGETQAFQIVIRNLGPGPAQLVRVEDQVPAGLRLLNADPAPLVNGDKLSWTLPLLGAQREQAITVTLQATSDVQPAHHVSVSVTSSSQTHVAALPARSNAAPLAVRITGPQQASIGKSVFFEVHVANQSSQPINGIKLFANLPEGLDTPEGRDIEGPEEGMLFLPGESKTLKMPANAVKPGRFNVRVKVGAAAVEAVDAASIEIVADSLLVHQEPKVRMYPGRDGDLRIDIANHTNRPLRNVAIANRLPDGIEFVAANERGLYQSNTRTVHWLIEQLPAGKTQTVFLRVHGAKPGQYSNNVVVKADGVAEQTSSSQLMLEGLSDLNLRVVERDTLVYLGKEVVYEIHIQNRGTSPDRNVQLQVQFPPGLRPKNVEGNTRHQMDHQTVTFEGMPSLGPQGSAVYRVTATTHATGDQRVRFLVISDAVRTPIQREVSTMVHRD